MKKRLIIFCFVIILTFLACESITDESTDSPAEEPTELPSSTPEPIDTPLPPTPTPTATPAWYVGIDEPALMPNIFMDCNGANMPVTARFTLQTARQHESIQMGDALVTPEIGFALYTLRSDIQYNLCIGEAPVARATTLVCENDEFDIGYLGLEFSSEGFISTYTYEIPEEIDFSECELQLPQGIVIPISPVFIE